ncbi:MAG: DUF4442 domain-containing protein [Desulfobacteraceae bacterium]|nr:DUF4442 domain-containing protein [Desulfobacteraceae bacterium]
MKMTPMLMKLGLNIYGPFVGAGVRVKMISADWRKTLVRMKLAWYNKNIMGTHFGGSLYSMTDPHLMLMLMQILGKQYQVWDQSAAINFICPGKGTVSSILEVTDTDLDVIRKKTENYQKYLHTFLVQVKDEDQNVVAEIKKVLYFRKKADPNIS